ncbi:MAG TPA: DUF2721 domain-containing protein [Pyrinomonadaceae bacterium]|jgi:hypothetical protein
MEALSSTLTVLTAMITPAVLISACGTMILSTSTRLGRVVDRVRNLSDRLEELAEGEQMKLLEERRIVIFEQLDKLTSRARILQRAMTLFYTALGVFVFTSVAIGIVAVSGSRYNWIPIIFALLGACCLLYGSILLIFEARLALGTIHSEMDFIWQFSKHFVPAEVVERYKPHSVHFRRHERKPKP